MTLQYGFVSADSRAREAQSKKQQIAKYVSVTLMSLRNEPRRCIAERLAPKFGLGRSYTLRIIEQYEKYNLYATSPNGLDSHAGVHLSRLASYIQELGLTNEQLDDLIPRLKEFDNRFEYPADPNKLVRLRPL